MRSFGLDQVAQIVLWFVIPAKGLPLAPGHPPDVIPAKAGIQGWWGVCQGHALTRGRNPENSLLKAAEVQYPPACRVFSFDCIPDKPARRSPCLISRLVPAGRCDPLTGGQAETVDRNSGRCPCVVASSTRVSVSGHGLCPALCGYGWRCPGLS